MNPLKKLGFGDSYVSLVLGIIVIAIVGVLLVSFIRRQAGLPQPLLPPAQVEEVEEEQTALPAKHTVAEGEDLWTISEKYYKSGYNWVDIASENNLPNPDVLTAGTELTIPNVEPKAPPAQEAQVGDTAVSIQTDSYTVVIGDNLWDIAVRAYGDGFKWVEIVRTNNLDNPDIIHAGNVLKLPR